MLFYLMSLHLTCDVPAHHPQMPRVYYIVERSNRSEGRDFIIPELSFDHTTKSDGKSGHRIASG